MIEMNRIYNEDYIDIIKNIDANSIDCIICDPPYNLTHIEYDKNIIDLDFLFSSFKRISKNNCAIIIFSQQPFTTKLISIGINYIPFKYEIIYQKTLATGFLNCKKQPLRCHENIEIFCKSTTIYNPQMWDSGIKKSSFKKCDTTTVYGKQKENQYYYSEGIRYPLSIAKFSNRPKYTTHASEKPLELINWLIKTYSNENDLILDCFSGSGSTAHSSIINNRNYICIEKDKKYYNESIKRINNINKTNKLFGVFIK
jgi:site-specific DNA-methyltransferase (adenine-specific)